MDVLLRHGFDGESRARSLGELLKTADVDDRRLTARPPFCVGWSISGSQNVSRQYASATKDELGRLGAFYRDLPKEDRRTVLTHAVWAVRATVEASVKDGAPRKVLMECCFHLVSSLDGAGLLRLLESEDSSLYHHDVLAPPKDVPERWAKLLPWLEDTRAAVATLLVPDYHGDGLNITDVPLTFVSWTIHVLCAHVYHASLYGTGLVQCSICLDDIASAAMSSCLHNMFCPTCLVKAAHTAARSGCTRGVVLPSKRRRYRRDDEPRYDDSLGADDIWFPCPVCRKVGRIL
mmetsp:Transcript_137/g.495  ORF Transcript_137/g.495 Transcript_137/m.495 type:complete len:291 (-) Transcript_137:344-1216(-)|eukprot:CAMPEP_0118908416 /NCGR_PEP_ID=MMETSP1166-20130328/11433_1 /TAXON_ID=1104430 /ORGANISM="Chrysoreinhardia sp, Strain CCMP3193" /LENGTH=290 /DNA_ID=CAMNT_0006847811 /DNA_START=168 /DNA_END=1040 /DNA_ORIENTATION=+